MNPTDTARALVEAYEAKVVQLTKAQKFPRSGYLYNAEFQHQNARAALLAHVAEMAQQLATIEAWLRDGHDENLSDRWICTPNGSEGPVVARGYEFEDIERPNLSMLADALATRPTEARDA